MVTVDLGHPAAPKGTRFFFSILFLVVQSAFSQKIKHLQCFTESEKGN